MPQSRKRQLSIDDALKQPTLSIDDALARPVVAPPTPPTQQPEGMFGSLQLGVAGPLLRNVVETATDFYNRPGETLQRVGRGALEFASAFDPAGNAYDPTGPNAQRIAELRSKAEAERPETVRLIERGMQEEEARPRTRAGRIAFGAGRVLGEVAFPTAPENLAGNVITAPFGAAAFKSAGKFVAPVLQRIRRGRGAAVTIEEALAPPVTEAAPSAPAPVTGSATPTVQRAMQQFEAEVQRINASNLTPRQKAIELETAIQRIGQEASGRPPGPGIPAVSLGARRGYPEAIQQFPENPNPIQQAGILPGESGPPPLSAETGAPEFGVSAAPEPSYTETTGPSVTAPMEMNAPGAASSSAAPAADINAPFEAGWTATPEQQALFKGAPTGSPREQASLGRSIASVFRTAAQANRTIRTVFDLSAPLNQGAVLSRAHPVAAIQSFGKMLRAIKPSNRAAIDNAILNDPLTKLGRDFDLHIATGGAPEEAFLIRQLNKVPGIGASEATYRTYLDTLRLSVWKSYVKSLQASGFFPENAPKAYRQAAQFINIATGRGALKPGSRLDKAMALGGDILFAPRNLAAKFQLLDPVRYATLAPGARKLVLRDAVTSFGSVLGTAMLLRAAGVGVGLDPRADDFLTARFGNHRYDLTGGLKTEVRFLARMISGIYNKTAGEGNLPADEPLNVAKNYVRGKVTPLLGTAYSLGTGTDIKGQKMADKSPTQIAVETVAPMTVEDFYDAYQDSGAVGILKSTPAIIGQRISVYPDRAKADFIATPDALRTEQLKAGETRWFLQPHRAKNKTEKDETPEQFAARKAKVDEWAQEYGQKLVTSPAYQNATPDLQKDARDYLKRVITVQSSQARPEVRGRLSPQAIIRSVKMSAAEKAVKAKKNAARK